MGRFRSLVYSDSNKRTLEKFNENTLSNVFLRIVGPPGALVRGENRQPLFLCELRGRIIVPIYDRYKFFPSAKKKFGHPIVSDKRDPIVRKNKTHPLLKKTSLRVYDHGSV